MTREECDKIGENRGKIAALFERVKELEAAVFSVDKKKAETPEPKYKVGDRLWLMPRKKWITPEEVYHMLYEGNFAYTADGTGWPESALRPNRWLPGEKAWWDGISVLDIPNVNPCEVEVRSYSAYRREYVVTGSNGGGYATEEHLSPLPKFPIGTRVECRNGNNTLIGYISRYDPGEKLQYQVKKENSYWWYSESDLSLAPPKPADEENERLSIDLVGAQKQLNICRKVAEARKERIRNLEYLLATCEWGGEAPNTLWGRCPFCGASEEDGCHYSNCEYDRILNKEGEDNG